MSNLFHQKKDRLQPPFANEDALIPSIKTESSLPYLKGSISPPLNNSSLTNRKGPTIYDLALRDRKHTLVEDDGKDDSGDNNLQRKREDFEPQKGYYKGFEAGREPFSKTQSQQKHKKEDSEHQKAHKKGFKGEKQSPPDTPAKVRTKFEGKKRNVLTRFKAKSKKKAAVVDIDSDSGSSFDPDDFDWQLVDPADYSYNIGIRAENVAHYMKAADKRLGEYSSELRECQRELGLLQWAIRHPHDSSNN